MDGIETWLTLEDMQRIWSVVMQNAPEVLASEDELTEFHRVVELAAQIKYGVQPAPEALQ
jgi:hypothetical protein